MNPSEIRKQTIIALFADDYLFARLVLKGGNALHMVHRLNLRSSLDLDFSMAGDFEDLDEARRHLFSALRRQFSTLGFVVFDERLSPKPELSGPDELPWWGGYELRFKLIGREKFDRLQGRLEKIRIDALPTGPRQERTFTVDVSKHEYTGASIGVAFDEYTIPVYSLEMIAAEKFRAVCRQMAEYGIPGVATPRARDFYDIHLIVTTRAIDLTTAENRTLIGHVFAAKRVPLELLGHLARYREFHRTDWPAVMDAAGGKPSYDTCFDFVLALAGRLLEPLRMVDPPL